MLVATAIGVFGCRDQEPVPVARPAVLKAALNASPKLSDFVVEASNSVRFQTGSNITINGGDVGARGTGTGPFLSGGVAIDAQTGTNVQVSHNIIADSVALGTGAHVGDVQTNRLVDGTGSTHGGVSGLVPLPSLPTAAAVTVGTANLTVATGATITTSPGRFANVSIGTGGTLRMPAGTYEMSNLTLSSSAHVEAQGAVVIRVANRFSSTSGGVIGPAAGVMVTAKSIRLEISGQNGTTGALTATPKAAAFGTGNTVKALVLVPNGTLLVDTGFVGTGAFLGRDVDFVTGSTVTFQDGFLSCTAASCNDGNPCTTDTCNADGSCSHGNVAAGTSCSDGNSCNGAETCNAAGVCVAGTPAQCVALDQCHDVGVCNAATGVCSNPPKANGASCSDGNACTQTDSCQAGVCVGGNAVTCVAQDQCHDPGTCSPATGTCSNPAKANGATCNDGNACTQSDTCQSGSCIGASPVVCMAQDQCHLAGACNPATGLCSSPTRADGTTCSDGNACTRTDSCQAGTCVGANPVTCAAQDQCHAAGTCNPASGVCSNPAQPDGTSCSDGNACTRTDTCQGGACAGANPVTCTAQDQCHGPGVCDSSTGACSNPAKADGTACSDGNACTQTDTCQAGACVGASPVTCSAQDQCHVAGTCDPSSGTCSNPSKANGAVCSDSNACTVGDTCQSGTCTGGPAVTCTALDACHDVGTCNQATGTCSNPAKPNGTACSDGNACTTVDTCVSGTCTGGAPVTCVAQDGCHDVGTCDPSSGACSNPAKANGASCDDGNACTLADVCQGGTCTGINPVTCAPSPGCTTAGTCNPATGSCSASTGCTTCGNGLMEAGEECDDGNTANNDGCSADCHHERCFGVSCVAQDVCHDTGVCNPATGVCSNPAKADGASCGDGNACNGAETCQAGTCTPGTPPPPPTIMMTDLCHDARCDPEIGWHLVPKPAGTICADANTCNGGESCDVLGFCAPGTPLADGTSCCGGTCQAGQCRLGPGVNAGADQVVASLLAPPPPGPRPPVTPITFTPIPVGRNAIGLDYHLPTKSLVLSVNYPYGVPNNFQLLASGGTLTAFTNFTLLNDEIYFAVAPDDGGGYSRGGFVAGEMFAATQIARIARVSRNGDIIANPWVTLPNGGFGGLRGQIIFDRTGVWGGDLIVSTTSAQVWRINSRAQASLVTSNMTGFFFEALTTVPNDVAKYGPWAGKIVVGDEEGTVITAVDALGRKTTFDLGIKCENILVVPPAANFFGNHFGLPLPQTADFAGGGILATPASQFAGMVGDILITEESGNKVWLVRWTGTQFQKTLINDAPAATGEWEHAAFAPVGLGQVPPPLPTARLQGTATSNQCPPSGGVLPSTWSVVSGPGSVTFGDVHSLTTSASFSRAGTYVLRLTGTDGALSSSDDITVTVQHQPTAVTVGPDIETAASAQTGAPVTVQVNGSFTDDGLGAAPVTTTWSQVNGPDTAVFTDPSATNTSVRLPRAGVYTLRMTAHDGDLSPSDDLVVTVTVAGACTPPPADLAAWWPGEGNAKDVVGGRNGTIQGALTFNDGKIASGMAFNSGDQAVLFQNDPLYNLSSPGFTAEFWMRGIKNQFDNLVYTIIDKGLDFNVLKGWAFQGDPPTGVLGFVIVNADTHNFTGVASGDVLDGKFHHVAGTWDGTAIRLYVDGVLQGSVPLTHPANNTNPLMFGHAYNDGTRRWPFQGQLDEVSIYRRALSQTEIQTIAAARIAGKCVAGATVCNGIACKPKDSCQAASCDPQTTACLFTTRPNGAFCSDLNACNGQETCQQGVCVGGTPPPPPVADACHQAQCSPSQGWQLVPGPAGVSCSDGNSCNGAETCDALGTCVPGAPPPEGSACGGGGTCRMAQCQVNHAPVVNAGPDQQINLPVRSVVLSGSVTDDGLPMGSTVKSRWSLVGGAGAVVFGNPLALATTATFDSPGMYVLRLTANDGALAASDDVFITVMGTQPVGNPPVVTITGPGDLTNVTAPIDVTGTVQSGTLLGWRLEYKEKSLDDEWHAIARGDTPVTDAVLGKFDPTLLLNGIYQLRLVGTDTSGRSATTPEDQPAVNVRGNFKVGQFTLSFLELSIPFSGIPVQFLRNYDSRDPRKGDFGFGWTLEASGVHVSESGKMGRSWQIVRTPDFIPTFCIQPIRGKHVTVTVGGRAYEFEAVPEDGCSSITQPDLVTIGFHALPGTNATLATQDQQAVLFVEGQLLDANGDVYDPNTYVLTLLNGTQVVVSDPTALGGSGMKSLTDTNGNSLTFSRGSITHSAGAGVTINRDTEDRITSIVDPMGKVYSYAYDVEGNLASATDPVGNTTRFAYDTALPHYVKDVIDPRGVRASRSEYDGDGRLISTTDAASKSITYGHDIGARREVVVSRTGDQTTYEYDVRGNVTRETDAEGGVTLRTFDDHDNLLTKTDQNGRTWTYTYNAVDLETSMTDPLNHTTTKTYTATLGKLRTDTDPLNHTTTNGYDIFGNVVSTTDALEHTTTYTYSPQGDLRVVTDAAGHATSYIYDRYGFMTLSHDRLGHETTYTNDSNGRRLSESRTRTTPAGTETVTTSYVYDDNGRVVETHQPDGSVLKTTFNAIGKVATTVDALNRTTTMTYDDLGQLIRTTYPDATFEETAYDDSGRRIASKDTGGRTTSYGYDRVGRLVKTTFADGALTLTGYDPGGRQTSTTDARGKVTTYGYDDAGRRTTVTDALSHTTTYAYDEAGRNTSVQDARTFTTSFTYDAANKRTGTTFADGTATATAFDQLGQRTSETDQAGRITSFAYDFEGRLVQVTDALSQATTYGYDEVGNRVSQSDANNHQTRFDYDKLGRQARRTLPDGKFETKVYDVQGRMTASIDFLGRTTTFGYDLRDRQTLRTYPDSSIVAFTYTPTGRRLTAVDARGTTSYQYDPRDRPTQLTYPDGRKLAYGYDAQGNRTSLTATVGTTALTTGFAYDDCNQVVRVTDPDGRTYAYGYDVNGAPSSLTQPNGVTTTYSYDNLNRLTNLVSKYGTTTLASYAYTLGPTGIRTQVDETGGPARVYRYDQLYRLTSETVTGSAASNYAKTFTYDLVGNRLSQVTSGAGAALAYTYDSRDRLLTENGVTYTWDHNGNLLGNSGGDSYMWDFDGQLTRITRSDGTTVDHVYDVDGNRVRTTVTPAGGPAVVTSYLVDTTVGLSQVVAETDGTAAVGAYYVRAGNELLAVRRAPVLACYLMDGLGSVRGLAGGAGVVTDTLTYSAFGERLAATGGDPQPYGFAGEPFDPVAGLAYHRARWMDPRTGRFVSSDPFMGVPELPVTLHQYGYGGADPVNMVDASGHAFTIGEFMAVVAIGYTVGAISTGLEQYALHGRVDAASVAAGANWGAALAPLAAGYPTIGLVLGGASTGYAAATFEPLFRDSTVSWDRKVLAGGLVAAGLLGTAAQAKFLSQNRFLPLPRPPEPTIRLYHKGELADGTVSASRSLSLGAAYESVAALRRPGEVHEFEVPIGRLMEWERQGLVRRFTDLDEATGVINQEIRVLPPASAELNNYKK